MSKIAKKKRRVFVGLSGGVDSSVVAALLKNQGYDVTGVFMRFWVEKKCREKGYCLVPAEAAAKLVAAKLDIPFYVFDVEKEFKKKVVDYFLRELKAGRTPNPCVVCNPEIKFGIFLRRALKLGADYVAMGHYARLRREFPISNFQFPKKIKNSNFKEVKLYQAKDKQKDQSYFLTRLSQSQLSKIIFPLGGYSKKEVYRLAAEWQLPYRRGESFDICFVNDYEQFLKKYLKMKPGKIIDLAGQVLGQHQGLPLYTIGQRAGLGGPGPFFVIKKDVKKNILFVSNNEKDLLQKEMQIKSMNWLSGRPFKLPLRCSVKIRYRGKAAEATLRPSLALLGVSHSGQELRVIFKKSQRAVTPGQSAVFYKKEEVLGGGVIL